MKEINLKDCRCVVADAGIFVKSITLTKSWNKVLKKKTMFYETHRETWKLQERNLKKKLQIVPTVTCRVSTNGLAAMKTILSDSYLAGKMKFLNLSPKVEKPKWIQVHWTRTLMNICLLTWIGWPAKSVRLFSDSMFLDLINEARNQSRCRLQMFKKKIYLFKIKILYSH